MALSVTNRGVWSTGSIVQQSTFTINPPQTFTSGLVIAIMAYNNSGGGGANQGYTISDSLGNTWTQGGFNLCDPGAAYNGSVLSFAYTYQNVGLITTSTTITWINGGNNNNIQNLKFSFYQVSGTLGTPTIYDIQAGGTNAQTGSTRLTDSYSWNTPPTTNFEIGWVQIGAVAMNITETFTPSTNTNYGTWLTAQTSSNSGLNYSMALCTQAKLTTSSGTGALTWSVSWSSSCFNSLIAIGVKEVVAGAFTITASGRALNNTLIAANILKKSKVIADVRSLTMTRNDATLFKSRTMVASGMVLNDNFFAAGLIATRKITADLMTEVLTFPSILLIRPRTMIANGLSLSISSSDTGFIYDIFAATYYDIQAEKYVSVISTTETKFIAPAPLPIQPPIGGGGSTALQYYLTANSRDFVISRKTAQGIITKVGLLTADIGVPTGTWSGTFGSRYTLINDIDDTTGTSVLTHGTTAGSHDFRHSLLSGIPTGSTINRVVLRHTTRRNGGATSVITANLGIKNASNQVVKYNAAVKTPLNGTFTTYDEIWNINPATNANWTIAQIIGDTTSGTLGVLAAQIGFTSNDANPTLSISRAYLLTTYTLYEVKQYSIQLSGISMIANPIIVFLEYNRTFLASGKNFSLTRFDAIVKKSFVIPIVQKSFSTTLVAANLLKTKKIIADARSLSIAPTTTNLAKGTRMTASGLFMSLSFVDVIFKKGINMVSSVRNFTISSIQVSLIKNLILTSNGRSFNISANNVDVLSAKKIVFSAGSLNMTATGSSLIHASRIVSGAGSLFIGGVVVNFRKAYVISATKAALNGSYSSSSLINARRIPINVSSLQIQGKVVNLTRVSLYNLSANPRSFTTTLNPSILKAAFKLSLVSKNIAISGQFTYLKKGIIFSAGKATFLMIPTEMVFKLKAGIIYKMWTGTGWKYARLKVWNGSSWVGELKRWTGIIWKNK